MGKDPAFLFYPGDFLMGVSDLTMEERGQLITLLSMHHQKGRLSKKSIDVAVPNVSKDVLAKFSIDQKGLYYNKRLEEEADKRRKHCQKQSHNAKKGWEKRKSQNQIKGRTRKDAMACATAMPLENENENSLIRKEVFKENQSYESQNKIESKSKKKKVDHTELFKRLKNERKYKEQENKG